MYLNWLLLVCCFIVPSLQFSENDTISGSRDEKNTLDTVQSDTVADPLDLIDISSTSTNIYDTLSIVENPSKNKVIDFDVDLVYSFPNNSKERKRATFGRRRIHKAEATESPESPELSATSRSLDDVWPFVIDYHHNHTHVTDVSIRKQYEFLHTISTKLNRAPRTESSKYIIFYPSKAGLGNTVAAWSEALLLSMYSQRFFKLYKWQVILQYYSIPFTDIIQESSSFLSGNDTFISQSGKHCGLNLEGILNGTDPHKYIVIRGYCGIIHYFIHTPYLTDWLTSVGVFPSSSLFALDRTHLLMQFLLVDVIVPQPLIWDAVVDFKMRSHWDNYTVLGIHIRTGLLEGNVGWGRFLEKEDVKVFYRDALRFTEKLEHLSPAKQVKWLVLVDNEGVKEEFKRLAGKYFLSTELQVVHSKEGVTKGIENSIIDNYILSECYTMILTMKSTYGYLAKHRCEASHRSIAPGSHKSKHSSV